MNQTTMLLLTRTSTTRYSERKIKKLSNNKQMLKLKQQFKMHQIKEENLRKNNQRSNKTKASKVSRINLNRQHLH